MSNSRGISDVITFAGAWDRQVVATSVHAGHDLRPDVAAVMTLDEDVRLREEDPHTDVIAAAVESRAITSRSRFEVDLNRPREEAVYRQPEDCWGLDVWSSGTLDDDLVQGSLEVYDEVYAALGRALDPVAARGPFVLLEVHSYNHRRGGAAAEPEPVEENPTVNLGTGTLDEKRFGTLRDAFVQCLQDQEVGGELLDVRENVKFQGRALSWWVHERYPGVGCCLALEFKKTFMDEWTAEVDRDRLAQITRALSATVPVLERALEELS